MAEAALHDKLYALSTAFWIARSLAGLSQQAVAFPIPGGHNNPALFW